MVIERELEQKTEITGWFVGIKRQVAMDGRTWWIENESKGMGSPMA